MESQGERVLGVLGMDGELVESMVQDEIPEQDTPVQDIPRNMLQQSPPQTNPSPKWARQRPRRMTPPLPLSAKTPRSLPKRLT